MINLYECHFEYDDKLSRDYGLIIANIETSRFMPITGFKSGSFLFNRKQKSLELMGDVYEDTPLTIEIEIVTCSSKHIEKRTLREIERWLFQNSTFKPMYIDIEDDPYGETYELIRGDYKRLYFNCRFIEPEKIEANGGVIGFRCKMETDSMMLWQEEFTTLYKMNPKCVIVNEGVERTLIPGDVDNDGIISLGDVQMILKVYTDLMGQYDVETIKEQDIKPYLLKRRVASGGSSVVQDYEVDDAYLMCDMRYTTENAAQGANPIINPQDALQALRIYTYNLGGVPVDMPDAMTILDPETHEYTDGIVIVDVDSDIDGYIYPEITVFVAGNGGDITIENIDDYNIDSDGEKIPRLFTIKDLSPMASFTIKCDINYIDPPSLYQKVQSPYFIRLASGKNRIRINGDVEKISFRWQNRRFL